MFVPQDQEWLQIWWKMLVCSSSGWWTGCHTLSCKSFFFNMATALLSSFFFGPFTRLLFAVTPVTRKATDLSCAVHRVHDNWVASLRTWSRRSWRQFYGRAQTCRNQSNVWNSRRPLRVTLKFDTKNLCSDWFALQNLRIGLRRRQSGKIEAAWKLAKSAFKLKERDRATFFSLSEHRCLLATILNLRKENLLWTPERRCIWSAVNTILPNTEKGDETATWKQWPRYIELWEWMRRTTASQTKLERRVHQQADHKAEHQWRRWLQRKRGVHESTRTAHRSTVVIVSFFGSSPERFHTPSMVIHMAHSLWLASPLSTSTSSSCLSPSSSSTSSCSLSSCTRSAWQTTCAAPLQKRVRTPWTPSSLTQVMSPSSWPSASSTTHQFPSPSWSFPRTRARMTWHSARCPLRHTEDKSTTAYQEACQSVSRRLCNVRWIRATWRRENWRSIRATWCHTKRDWSSQQIF